LSRVTELIFNVIDRVTSRGGLYRPLPPLSPGYEFRNLTLEQWSNERQRLTAQSHATAVALQREPATLIRRDMEFARQLAAEEEDERRRERAQRHADEALARKLAHQRDTNASSGGGGGGGGHVHNNNSSSSHSSNSGNQSSSSMSLSAAAAAAAIGNDPTFAAMTDQERQDHIFAAQLQARERVRCALRRIVL
jgi:pyruvate/2-oxoglutarate dehydrogenase complex dihydrolipoamide acyltransferase (E2) component